MTISNISYQPLEWSSDIGKYVPLTEPRVIKDNDPDPVLSMKIAIDECVHGYVDHKAVLVKYYDDYLRRWEEHVHERKFDK